MALYLIVAGSTPSGSGLTESGSGLTVDFAVVGRRTEYNVVDYGTVGNGVADDSTALQAALNAAYTAGGGIVRVPEGTYKVNTGLYIRTNVHMVLSSRAKIVKGADVVLMTFGDPGIDNGAGYTGHHDMSITGGIWDMKGATLTTYRVGMATGHNKNIALTNVTFMDTPGHHAIEINSTKGARVRNCRFLGFYHTGDRFFSEAIQIDLAKSASIGTMAPYDHTSCEDIQVTGCYFGASGTVGTFAWARGIGSHSSTIGVRHRDIIIEGNTFEGLIGVGVGPYSWDNTVIANNIFDACAGGIVAETPNPADTGDTLNTSDVQTNDSQDCTGLVIAGNTFRNTGDGNPTIAVVSYGTKYFKSVTVANNTINGPAVTATTNDSMSIIRTQNTSITGNSITGSGDMGISCITGDYVSITGNTITETVTLGMQISGMNDIVIEGNTLRNLGQHGIQVINGGDVSIKNNNIKGASRSANNSFYGIRLSQTVVGYHIAGNRVRKFGSGNELAKGISVANTSSGGSIRGNDIQDTGFEDLGTSPATSTGNPKAASVNAAATATSTTYGTPATGSAGPAVTLDTGTSAIVILSSNLSNTNANAFALASYAVSGATSISGSDDYAVAFKSDSANQQTQGSYVHYVTGLTVGSNTFTMVYRALSGGTANFDRRHITVIPLNT